jgi:hypothetical protein
MHLSPGNSKVNAPPPLEIPRFLNRGGADNNWNSPLPVPERNKAILTWIIENIGDVLELDPCAIQNKVWPPPSLKKLPEALIISPELRHLYIHTDRQTQNRDLDNT